MVSSSPEIQLTLFLVMLYEKERQEGWQQLCVSVSTGDHTKPPAFHFLGLVLLCVSACVTKQCSEPYSPLLSADKDTTR